MCPRHILIVKGQDQRENVWLPDCLRKFFHFFRQSECGTYRILLSGLLFQLATKHTTSDLVFLATAIPAFWRKPFSKLAGSRPDANIFHFYLTVWGFSSHRGKLISAVATFKVTCTLPLHYKVSPSLAGTPSSASCQRLSGCVVTRAPGLEQSRRIPPCPMQGTEGLLPPCLCLSLGFRHPRQLLRQPLIRRPELLI